MNALNPVVNGQAVAQLFSLLRRHRELTWELTKREFSDRYAGQFLGWAWAVAHPTLTVLVYVFVFAVVFQVKMDAGGLSVPGDYTLYILSGLVPWLAFQEVLAKGSQVIASNSNLVKQVIFPVEILPTKCVLATVATQLVFLGLILLYMLARQRFLPWTIALLPALLAIQFAGMLGLSMILAAVGAYVRDLKDFVQVFCMVNIYLMPVVYMPNWVPERLQPLIYLNPFSYQTWCFQDAIYFGSINHPWAWVITIFMNLAFLALGYRAFRALKIYFGNVL